MQLKTQCQDGRCGFCTNWYIHRTRYGLVWILLIGARLPIWKVVSPMTVLSRTSWNKSYEWEVDGEKDWWHLPWCESLIFLNWHTPKNQYEKWRFGRWCRIIGHIHHPSSGHISIRSACSNLNMILRLLLFRFLPLGRHYWFAAKIIKTIYHTSDSGTNVEYFILPAHPFDRHTWLAENAHKNL